MDFKDTINQLAERISKQKELIQTEEATKNAFIMPMISALGYDIFNPTEVVPEFTCDVGIKKGEKIDYAIMQDNKPVLLIECKHCNSKLEAHDGQLTRYFTVSDAMFAILTNGIEYKFYTDMAKKNIMDEKPFLIINILELSENDIEQLKKFHKSYFDENTILSTAAELKISTALKEAVTKEFTAPTADFVKHFVRAINDGSYSQKLIDKYTPLLKKAIGVYVNDVITERLNNAINDGKKQEPVESSITPETENSIQTTEEEIDSFLIIKNILRKEIDVSQINYVDFKSYFLIYIGEKQFRWICRLYFLSKTKYITFPKPEGGETRVDIKTLEDIYTHADLFIEALKLRLN